LISGVFIEIVSSGPPLCLLPPYAIFEHSRRYLHRKFRKSQALNINLEQDVIVIGTIEHEKNNSKSRENLPPNKTPYIFFTQYVNRLGIKTIVSFILL